MNMTSSADQSVFGITSFEYDTTAPYGIRPGQTWKSAQPEYYPDLKVTGIQKRSKEQLIFVEDLSTGKARSISAYHLARTGRYFLKTTR